jgi:gliding motility-associated protein GldM
LQKEILTARADAVALVRGRVGGGEYSFNNIVALAYGPEVANANEEVNIEVMMAAFDSDKQPIVTVNGGSLKETHDGRGFVTAKAGGSELNLSGTITILNKSGVPKTMPWEKKIVVMKPQGTVSLPDMRVLYRGYQNVVEAVASGYDQTSVSGSGVTLSKSGAQWIASPGSGKTCKITVSGKSTASNKTVSLGSFEFMIKSMPKAEIYWGQAADGEKGSITATQLYARYGDGIPLTKAKFQVTQWAMSIPGAPKTVTGTGSTLSAEAMRFLKAAPKGSQVGFSCIYSGTGVKNKIASSMFKL